MAFPSSNLKKTVQDGKESLAVNIHRAHGPSENFDMTPIEKAFAKLKRLLRKSAERTVENLWNRIGTLIETFTPTECRNDFHSCEYG